jgi:hypothetical protein
MINREHRVLRTWAPLALAVGTICKCGHREKKRHGIAPPADKEKYAL